MCLTPLCLDFPISRMEYCLIEFWGGYCDSARTAFSTASSALSTPSLLVAVSLVAGVISLVVGRIQRFIF